MNYRYLTTRQYLARAHRVERARHGLCVAKTEMFFAGRYATSPLVITHIGVAA